MKQAKRKVKFRGITAHAKLLGVTRQHLFYVLRGTRSSRPLIHRYNQLKKAA